MQKTTPFYQTNLFGIGLSLVILLLLKLIDFNGLYGQDSHEYLRYTNYLKNNLFNLGNVKDYFWPIMYPLIGAVTSFTKIAPILILQFISIFSLVFSSIYLQKIIKVLYNKESLIYIISFFMLSPFVFRFGTVIMSDMLCLLFLIVGFYHLLNYNNTTKFKFLLYSVILFSFSFYTRYVVVVLFLFPFLWSFFKHFKKRKISYYLFLILPIIIISIPHYLIKTASLVTFEHSWLVNWSFSNFINNEFTTVEGIKTYRLPNIVFVWLQNGLPKYFFLGFILLFFAKKKDFKLILLLGLFSYLIFLAGIPFQNSRFLLLSFPLIITLLFPSFTRFMLLFKNKKQIAIIGFVIIQLFLIIYSFRSIYSLNQIEKENVASIIKLSDTKIIYTSGYEGPLRSYSDKKVIGIWMDSIITVKKGLFMINELEMKNNSYPETINYNYQKLKNNISLQKLKTFNKGWTLYEIQ